MKILDIKNINSIKSAAKILKSGGVLVFPTDTVYGIGCLLMDDAIKKLYKIKNRSLNQPTAVLMTRNFFDAKRTKELILDLPMEEKFLSGQLTIIGSVDDYATLFPKIITADNTIGIRLPQYSWLEELINITGPIVTASANKRGEETPTNFNQISKLIIEESDLVIKTNEKLSPKASTIYDLTKNEILRS